MLVMQSSQLSTTENYDISRTWSQGTNGPSADTLDIDDGRAADASLQNENTHHSANS